MRVSASWLALREPADAAARATELVEQLPRPDRHVIHDLGAGTGSLGRWLAPRLTGPQRWVLHDTDPDLLELATIDGATVETRVSDVTRLRPGDLAGATLVTASALLDLLTADELARLIAACGAYPVLLTLSVVGRVELTPADPLDPQLEEAFNAHQRRDGLLGPDAVPAAADAFRRLGHEVLVAPSAWRLDAQHAELAAEWFTGWVAAARASGSDPDARYVRRRLAQAAAGELRVTVHHADLLALPTGQPVPKRGDSA